MRNLEVQKPVMCKSDQDAKTSFFFFFFLLISCTSSSQEDTRSEGWCLERKNHGAAGTWAACTADSSTQPGVPASSITFLRCFYSLLAAHVQSTHYQGVPRSYEVTRGGERFVGEVFKQSHTCDDVVLQNPLKPPYGNHPWIGSVFTPRLNTMGLKWLHLTSDRIPE